MIIIDCGTGETKLYLVQEAGRDADGPIVKVDQMGEVMPSAIDTFHKLRDGDTQCLKLFIQDYSDRLREALKTVEQEGKKSRLSRVTVGLTAWWRTLSADDKMDCYNLMFKPLEKPTSEISKELSFDSLEYQVESIFGLDEARYEAVAVRYATERAFHAKTTDMIISGGKGSIQFTPRERAESTSGHHSAHRVDDIAPMTVNLDMKRGEKVVKESNVEDWQDECDVMLGQAIAVYTQFFENMDRTEKPESIYVVVISAFYYGAKAAGLVDKEPKEVPLEDALRTLEGFMKRSDTKPGDVANLVRMQTCFNLMFPKALRPKVHVIFARDWVVEGETFRTTWSSGYFLEYCKDPQKHPSSSKLRSQLGKKLSEFCEEDEQRLPGCCTAASSAVTWKDLGNEGANDVHTAILRYDDMGDPAIWEVPYTERTDFMVGEPCEPTDLNKDANDPSDMRGGWSQVGFSKTAPINTTSGKGPIGVELHYDPGGVVDATIIVVGFLACRRSVSQSSGVSSDAANGSGSQDSAVLFPCPAVGYKAASLDLHPVVDVGVAFSAADQGGSIRLQIGVDTSQLICPWNPYERSTFQIWFTASTDGSTQMINFARNKVVIAKLPMLKKRRFEFPAAVHAWVGPAKGESDILAIGAKIEWINSELGCCESLHWGLGSLSQQLSRCISSLSSCMDKFIPNSLRQSFHRFHTDSGIRFTSMWPPQCLVHSSSQSEAHSLFVMDKENTTQPLLTVTAGSADIMVWNGEGDCISRVSLPHLEMDVLSAVILDCKRISNEKKGWELHVLAGCQALNTEEGKVSPYPSLVAFQGFIPDYFQSAVGRDIREKDYEVTTELIADPNKAAWGQDGKGHSNAVSGIFVDYSRRPKLLVYTVSHDQTPMLWDQDGKLLAHSKGHHSKILVNGALTDDGEYFATVGLDRVCIFATCASGSRPSLVCISRVEHSMVDPKGKRDLYAAAFTPRCAWPTSVPDCLLLGDFLGNIVVAFLDLKEETLRKESELTSHAVHHHANIVTYNNVRSVAKLPHCHQATVFRLCWIKKPSSSPSPAENCERTDTEPLVSQSGSSFDETVRDLVLCSTSADMFIGTYDWGVVERTLEHAKKIHRNTGTNENNGGLGGSTPISEPQIAENDEGVRTIRWHVGAVQGASSDCFQRLSSGGVGQLVSWEGVGNESAHPRVWSRDAVGADVRLILSTTVVCAMQMLRFTIGGSAMSGVTSMRTLGLTSQLAAMDDDSLLSVTSSLCPYWIDSLQFVAHFWIHVIKPSFFFFLTILIICYVPSCLRKYRQVAAELETNRELTWTKRRGLERWRFFLRFSVAVFFNFLTIPLVTAFVIHVDCSVIKEGDVSGAAGELWYGAARAMDNRPEQVCFLGYHLVKTMIWIVAIVLYLMFSALFEIINMNLSEIFMIRIWGNPAFEQEDTRGETNGDKLEKQEHFNFGLLRVIYVAFCHMPVACVEVSHPRMNIGALTPSKYSITRWWRLVMKIIAPGILVFQTHFPGRQMWVYMIISTINIAFHHWRPPFRNKDLNTVVILIQYFVWFGAASSLFEVVIEPAIFPEGVEGHHHEISGYLFYLGFSTCCFITWAWTRWQRWMFPDRLVTTKLSIDKAGERKTIRLTAGVNTVLDQPAE